GACCLPAGPGPPDLLWPPAAPRPAARLRASPRRRPRALGAHRDVLRPPDACNHARCPLRRSRVEVVSDRVPRSLVVGPGQGRSLRNPVGGSIEVKALGEQTGEGLSAIETEGAH